ncbi:hypothetical protein pb186bvf_000636 [Paramecium bursaria]
MNGFQELSKLGSGSYSEVYKVIRLQDSQIYAMKKIKIAMLKEKEKQNALNEIRLLASLNNDFIISYKDAMYSDENKTLAIIMEYADGGDIQKIIQNKQRNSEQFDESDVWKALLQITQGLKELHDKQILHRDIKSANIFISHGNYKLGDLNVSKIAQRGLVYTQTGTPYYASPEIWRDEPYDNKSDIWSLGCVLYEMCTLKPPFQANDMEQLYKKIQKGIYPQIFGFSSQLITIISHMLRLNASSRPTCEQILNNPLILNEHKFHLKRIYGQSNRLMKTIQLPKNLNNLKDILPGNKYENLDNKENNYYCRASSIHKENKDSQQRYSVQSYKLIPIRKSINQKSENSQIQYSIDLDQESKRLYRIASVHDNIPTLPSEVHKQKSVTRRRPSSQYQNIDENEELEQRALSILQKKSLNKQMSDNNQIQKQNLKKLTNLPYLYKRFRTEKICSNTTINYSKTQKTNYIIIMIILLFIIQTFGQDCQPYGIRLSLGYYYTFIEDHLNKIVITFNTIDQCNGLTLKVQDNTSQLHNVNASQIKHLNMTNIYQNTDYPYVYETYIHIYNLGSVQNISDGRQYYYQIYQGDQQLTDQQSFDVPNKYTQTNKFLVFGDMDSNWVKNTSKPTFDWLQNQISLNISYDSILFTGDLAYDLESDNCQRGDYFLRNLSSFTQRYPFMTAPGNHEVGKNMQFDFYYYNFNNPWFAIQDKRYRFYSFQMGLTYFIQYDPIDMIYNRADQSYVATQLDLMEQELQRVDRKKTPWLIVFSHYPVYCSGLQDIKCTTNYQTLTKFEDLFKKYKVDIYFSGHQHNYERIKPYYKNKLANFKQENNYSIIRQNDSPMFVIEGTAGNDYFMPDEIYDEQPYTIFQAIGNGVGSMVINETHLSYQHIQVASNKVVDQFWIIKDATINQDTKLIDIVMYTAGSLVILGLISLGLIYLYRKKKHQAVLIDQDPNN